MTYFSGWGKGGDCFVAVNIARNSTEAKDASHPNHVSCNPFWPMNLAFVSLLFMSLAKLILFIIIKMYFPDLFDKHYFLFSYLSLWLILSAGTIVEYEKDPIGTAAEHVYDIVLSAQDDSFHLSVREAVQVVEKALDKYRYNHQWDIFAIFSSDYTICEKLLPFSFEPVSS